MKRQFYRTAVGLMTGIALLFCAAFMPASADIRYVENEWNFVDGSMDVTHGIPENATGVLDRIRRKGVLRVATEPYFAPQEFIDPEKKDQEQYAGADMELARLIAERMGVALEIIPMDFSDVLPALTEDLCDLTISAIAFTPGRAAAYTMSKGYYFSESLASTAVIIREADRENITTEKDLSDKRIVAQSSSLQEAQAADHILSYLEFRRVSSVQTVYEAVRDGRADAGIVDMETAETYIRNNPDAGQALVEGIYYTLDEQYLGDRIVAKKDELQLMYFVNGVIDEVLESGAYTRWMEEAQKRSDELGL
jgi:polar amino acid transport system substrate-binding protein